MSMFNKYKILMYHVDGLPYRHNSGVNLTFDSDFQNITFKEFMAKSPEVILPVSKITRAGTIKTEDVVNGSTLGRAAVGGLLFGGAGAIVGAMSAQDRKKVTYLYCINYMSGDVEKAIVLKSGGDISEMKFRRKLSELLPHEEISNDDPIVL